MVVRRFVWVLGGVRDPTRDFFRNDITDDCIRESLCSRLTHCNRDGLFLVVARVASFYEVLWHRSSRSPDGHANVRNMFSFVSLGWQSSHSLHNLFLYQASLERWRGPKLV